jgi:hypothetical protein
MDAPTIADLKTTHVDRLRQRRTSVRSENLVVDRQLAAQLGQAFAEFCNGTQLSYFGIAGSFGHTDGLESRVESKSRLYHGQLGSLSRKRLSG